MGCPRLGDVQESRGAVVPQPGEQACNTRIERLRPPSRLRFISPGAKVRLLAFPLLLASILWLCAKHLVAQQVRKPEQRLGIRTSRCILSCARTDKLQEVVWVVALSVSELTSGRLPCSGAIGRGMSQDELGTIPEQKVQSLSRGGLLIGEGQRKCSLRLTGRV